MKIHVITATARYMELSGEKMFVCKDAFRDRIAAERHLPTFVQGIADSNVTRDFPVCVARASIVELELI